MIYCIWPKNDKKNQNNNFEIITLKDVRNNRVTRSGLLQTTLFFCQKLHDNGLQINIEYTLLIKDYSDFIYIS